MDSLWLNKISLLELTSIDRTIIASPNSDLIAPNSFVVLKNIFDDSGSFNVLSISLILL